MNCQDEGPIPIWSGHLWSPWDIPKARGSGPSYSHPQSPRVTAPALPQSCKPMPTAQPWPKDAGKGRWMQVRVGGRRPPHTQLTCE